MCETTLVMLICNNSMKMGIFWWKVSFLRDYSILCSILLGYSGKLQTSQTIRKPLDETDTIIHITDCISGPGGSATWQTKFGIIGQ